MKNTDERKTNDVNGQLRLALVELGRIEREIAELEERAQRDEDRGLLQSLRMCRSVLVRVAHAHLPRSA